MTAKLRLARTPGIGPIRYFELVERLGSAEAALEALPGFGFRPPPAREAEEELEALARLGARPVWFGDDDYPLSLSRIADPPPFLAALGDLSLAMTPVVAMVGARNASAAGQRIAERLARALGEAGFTVVSGLARGIDAAAHRGALACGTIAVLAGGIDRPYPPQNRTLFDAIAADGLALAENPPGFQARAQDFPRRNRIVAGLASGVVVVEAAARSGSLITARLAAEEGRQVFAVPGSPLDPRNAGCHELIRNGATLVTTADDIAEALADSIAPPAQPRPATRRSGRAISPPPDPAPPSDASGPGTESSLLSALGPVPVTVDELARRCHLSSAAVAAMLLDLELAGRVERHPGQRVSLISR